MLASISRLVIVAYMCFQHLLERDHPQSMLGTHLQETFHQGTTFYVHMPEVMKSCNDKQDPYRLGHHDRIKGLSIDNIVNWTKTISYKH